ncbi:MULTISPECIES: hypothetical protein [unclassified Cryobacterium]|uniref:hypothetical protein n=1 Tax=unclassified Cryobacterium TaxID=2649013 RepID=UPI00106BBAAE|nr:MULTISPECIES: hypothetical protein [unclassified Cryobacterium]TFC26407.1 hypothetical protein E3O22_12290 [Cryobacterium sp. TMT2-18-2]
MQSRSFRVVGAAVVAVLALAGCSSPTPTAISAAPATGETLFGGGYDLTVPRGWSVPKDVTLPDDVDVIAADLADADGFVDNVNVIVSPAGGMTPDQAESSAVDEFEGAGVNVTIRDRIMVAETESVHLSAKGSINGADYQIEQFHIPVTDWNTFVVTFSFSPTVSEADRNKLSESVLATWSWT